MKITYQNFIITIALLTVLLSICHSLSTIIEKPKSRVVSWDPYLQVIDSFLSVRECKYIIDYAEKQKFKSSTVINSKEKPSVVDQSIRTSHSVFLKPYIHEQDQIIKNVYMKAAKLAHVSPTKIEAIQITRYEPNQHYKVHHDYMSSTDDQRIKTIFVYLNTYPNMKKVPVHEKSGTFFPGLGVRIIPKRGRATYWYNVDEYANVNPLTAHTGEPHRIKNWKKYGMNIWIRQKDQH